MTLLVLVAVCALGVVGAVVRALLIDEARGRLQRRISADVERTIASLPQGLQAEWADEWRAELAATISMPLAASAFAWGLRKSATELVRNHAGDPLADSHRTRQPVSKSRRQQPSAKARPARRRLRDTQPLVINAMVSGSVGTIVSGAIFGADSRFMVIACLEFLLSLTLRVRLSTAARRRSQ
jgi:hypothetical protein